MSFPVVVTGNTTDPQFAVSSFLALPAPSRTMVETNFTGCVVDCSGTLAAVGSYGSGQVAIYDLSDPASPQLQGTVPSTISAIIGNPFVPGTCDFDGSTAVFADSGSDNIFVYSISGGDASYQAAGNTGLNPPVSIAVLGNQIAVGSIRSNLV